ncbi:TKL protein kinase [Phytophthora cinnamomi]|uniref:TKL protein kinase n=1 Tax=Phytophthora cinnamomi TaxID=4785 RepID=UPI003559E463|nr:TKL protein kinase [Phytophthora cinnamomi]
MVSAVATIALVLATAVESVDSRSIWAAQELFDAHNCSGTPVAVSLATVASCSPSECASVEINNATQFVNLECNVTDRFAYAEEVFGQFNYIVVEDYADAGCENLRLTTVLPATGSCGESTLYGSYSIIATLFANGSAVISLYNDGGCEGDAFLDFILDSGNISSGDCVQNYYKFYTSASTTGFGDGSVGVGSDSSSTSSSVALGSSTKSSISTVAIVCIIIAAATVGFLAAIFIWKRRSPTDKLRTDDPDCAADHDSYTRWLSRALTVSPLLAVPSLATNWSAVELYSGSHCAGTPNVLKLIATENCDADACTPHDLGGYTLFVSATCNVTDRFKYTEELFTGFDYVMMEEYDGDGCNHLLQTSVYPASGTCEKSSALANTTDIVSLFNNGSAVVSLFDNGDCGGEPSHHFVLDSDTLSDGVCVQGHYRFYTGTASGSTDSTGSMYSYGGSQLDSEGISGSAIAGIVFGSVACVAVLAFATFKFIRLRNEDDLSKDTGIAALAASYAGYPTPESALSAITLGSEASQSQGDA